MSNLNTYVVFGGYPVPFTATQPAAGVTPVYFATLSATAPTQSRQVQFVDSYSAATTRGGGFFAWSATSTATPDNGTVSAGPGGTGVAGRWLRVISGPISPSWYGALGTFSDDHVAITAAMTAAASGLGGGIVQFDPGVYASSVALTLPTNVSLQGSGYTELLFTGGTNGINWTGTAYQTAGYIRDISINGNGASPGVGLNITLLLSARLDRVNVTGFTHQGIYHLSTVLCEAKLCTVVSCGSTGGTPGNGGTGYAAWEIDGVQNAGPSSAAFTMVNCNIGPNNGPAGIRVDRTGNIVMLGGTSEDSGICLQISSKTETVTGSALYHIAGVDFEISSTNARTTSFIELGYGLSGGSAYARVRNITIQNCSIGCDAGAVLYGIKCNRTDGFYASGVNFSPVNGAGTVDGNMWFEGATNTGMALGVNALTNAQPYVVVNGVTDITAGVQIGGVGAVSSSNPWSYGSLAAGGGVYGSSWNVPTVSTPATPVSGFTFYVDSADSKFKAVGSAGTVNVIDATALTP